MATSKQETQAGATAPACISKLTIRNRVIRICLHDDSIRISVYRVVGGIEQLPLGYILAVETGDER